MTRRTERLGSLLREVISDVIHKEVKNPNLPSLVTVTQVSVTADLHYAKVMISVIGDDKQKEAALEALKSAAAFIAVRATKQVSMRCFPELQFYLDDSAEKQMQIEKALYKIQQEREERG